MFTKKNLEKMYLFLFFQKFTNIQAVMKVLKKKTKLKLVRRVKSTTSTNLNTWTNQIYITL